MPPARELRRRAPPKSRFTGIEMVHGSGGQHRVRHDEPPVVAGHRRAATSSSRRSCKPLEPFRDYLTVVSHTDCTGADPFTAEEVGADHFRSSAVFLTAAHPKQTEGSDIRNGTSIDQLYAQAHGQDTPLPSIQLCIENLDSSGTCGYNYSCAYMDTISWADADDAAADDARSAAGLRGAVRHRRHRRPIAPTATAINRSILDSITQRHVAGCSATWIAKDRSRLNDYLENIREIERRIQKIEAYNTAHGPERELPAAPIGVPDSWEEHVKLMFDLQVLAFAADVTRVSTLQAEPRHQQPRVRRKRLHARRGTRPRITASAPRRSRTRPRSTAIT